MGSDKWPASEKITQLRLSMATGDRIFSRHNETFPLISDTAGFLSKATGPSVQNIGVFMKPKH